VRETALESSRPEKKEREEALQAPEQRFPCSPLQVVPMQPMEDHSKASIHTAVHGGPHTGAGSCQEL